MSETTGTLQKVCPRCGGVSDTDARFCKHCAFDLSNPSLASDATVVTSTSKWKTNPTPMFRVVGAAIIGLLVLGLIGTYVYTRNPARPNTAAASATPVPTPAMGDKAKQGEDKILRGEALNDSDLAGLSAYELRVLRNVHFARYGRKYDSPGLGDYFNTRPWYKPSDSYNESMITAKDKASINMILAAENQAKQAESAASSNANSNHSPQNTAAAANTSNQLEATSSASGSSGVGLTDGKVQLAVRSFMRDFTKGGSINVEGVQELPNQNAATADLRFSNWVCSTTYEGGLSKQAPPPVTHDRYGMPSSTFGLRLRTYNTPGLAVLKRYNDGRWVLKEVRVGSGFNTVTISGTQEIR